MKNKTKKIFSLTIYMAILIFSQLPLFQVNGRWHTIYGFYTYIQKVQPADLFKVQMIIFIIYQVICVSYLLMVLIKKVRLFNLFCVLIGVANVMWSNVMLASGDMGNLAENKISIVYPNLLLFLNLIEFIIPKMLDAKKEAEEEARKSVERDKAFKEEKKRRLYFEGSYPKLFYQVIWKNFRYKWKDYILLVLSSLMIVTLTFISFGCYEMLAGLHSKQSFIIGTGLGRILYSAFVPIGICSVALIIYVLLAYLKKRMVSYSMILVLGSRKRAVYLMLAIEIFFNLFFAFVVGCILGNAALFLLKKAVQGEFGADVALSGVTGATYLKMIGVVLLIYLVAIISTIQIIRDTNIISAATRNVREEKTPKKLVPLAVFIGVIVGIYSILKYGKMQSSEDIKLLIVYFVGLFLIVRYGMALYLRKMRRGKKYLSQLIDKNQLYYKSKTVTVQMVILSLIGVCITFYFSFSLISITLDEDTDKLYPYDFICIADGEDMSIFENIKKEYNAEITSYPMVRISSADGREGIESPGTHSPQGQHIGISEKTYHLLQKKLHADYKEDSLGLDADGRYIHIVHQQDRSIKAQPVDFQFPRSSPRLHVGMPCIYYSATAPDRINGYPRRKIKSEEINSLTGCFRQGTQENLIVFSDEYFSKAQKMWEYTNIQTGQEIAEKKERIQDVTIRQGPTALVLIKTNTAYVDKAEKELRRLKEQPNHIYEAQYSNEVSCYYSKKQSVYDMKTEHILRIIANVTVIITFMIAQIFFICINVVSDLEYKVKRAEFLNTMGMSRKKRIRVLRKEVARFLWIPSIIVVVSTACFTGMTFHVRMYPNALVELYLRRVVWIWGIWMLFEVLIIMFLSVFAVHRVEGKR